MSSSTFLRITKNYITTATLGISLFSATFVLSLLIGTAANHPVLGPLDTLYEYVAAVLGISVLIVIAQELLLQVDKLRSPKLAPGLVRLSSRRQLIESSLRDQLRSRPPQLRRQVQVR